MPILIYLISFIVLSVISAPRFMRPCWWKVDSHYFIAQFEKWTAYSHSSITHVMIFWGISMHSFVPPYFYQNQFLGLSWLNWRYCCNFRYLFKQEQDQFYCMKTHFCAWLIPLRTKITSAEIQKVPILSNSLTEYAYHRFVDHIWLHVIANDPLSTR